MAVNDASRNARDAAQHEARALELPFADCLPNGAAAHQHAVDLDRADNLNIEAAARSPSSQGLCAAGAPVTEADTMPTHDGTHAQPVDQEATHEVIGANRCNRLREV